MNWDVYLFSFGLIDYCKPKQPFYVSIKLLSIKDYHYNVFE